MTQNDPNPSPSPTPDVEHTVRLVKLRERAREWLRRGMRPEQLGLTSGLTALVGLFFLLGALRLASWAPLDNVETAPGQTPAATVVAPAGGAPASTPSDPKPDPKGLAAAKAAARARAKTAGAALAEAKAKAEAEAEAKSAESRQGFDAAAAGPVSFPSGSRDDTADAKYNAEDKESGTRADGSG